MFRAWSNTARGLLAEADGRWLLNSLSGMSNAGRLAVDVPIGASTFGFVSRGTQTLQLRSGPLLGASFLVHAGMHFCCVGPFTLVGDGRPTDGFAVSCGYSKAPSDNDFRALGQLTLGGPLEEDGRLLYIDGCTDSL